MPLFNGRINRNPARYSNPVELAKAIDAYVDLVQGSTVEQDTEGNERGVRADGTIAWFDSFKKDGSKIRRYTNPPSIGGLCLHLGFSSKSQLVSKLLGENRHLREVVASTFLWLETFFVENMQREGAPVSSYQFMLTNMGWTTSKNPTEGSAPMELPRRQDQISAPTINLNFVTSPRSQSEEVTRRQLLAEADGTAIDMIDDNIQVVSPPRAQVD